MAAFFSIILPVYNRSSIVKRALDSLWQQSFQDWDLWIVDDGSTDNTIAVIEQTIQNKSQAHLLKTLHQGAAKARNHALRQAQGKYVTFLDSDDEYATEHLNLHHQLLQENPCVDFLYGKVKSDGNPQVPDVHNLNQKIGIEDCIVTGTLFIKRDCIEKAGYFPEVSYAEDFFLVEKLKSLGTVGKESPHRTYLYSPQADSISQQLFLSPNNLRVF